VETVLKFKNVKKSLLATRCKNEDQAVLVFFSVCFDDLNEIWNLHCRWGKYVPLVQGFRRCNAVSNRNKNIWKNVRG